MKLVKGGIFTGGPRGVGGCFGNLPSTIVDGKLRSKGIKELCGTGTGTWTDQPLCGLPPNTEGWDVFEPNWQDIPFETGPMDPEVNDPALVTEPKATTWVNPNFRNPNFERQAAKASRSSRGRTLNYGSTRK